MPSNAKRKRIRLSPKPILDKKLLLEALKQRGITLKEIHISTFYQQLHRQNYPDLNSFVEEYYRNEGVPSKFNLGEREEDLIVKPALTKNPISKSRTKRNVRRLPKAFLNFLADPNNDFVTVTSSIDSRPTSSDGTTTKLAVKLQDDHIVESVLMRHVSEEGSRATLCVSSQVGCAMGCTFCATGTMGIRGNLSSGEILEQLVHAGKILNEDIDFESSETIVSANGLKKKKSDHTLNLVRNIVFMGMGEPLNNYDNVIDACRAMIDRRRWNLAHCRVTVSTVGITPKMRQLTIDLPEVNLALSLHAPNQPMREEIVPTAKIYPIQDIINALHEHMTALSKPEPHSRRNNITEEKHARKKKRAMIEYVMLNGNTSSFACAHQLGKLCENKNLVVNLIPYNQTDVKDKHSCPTEQHMKEFQRIVSTYGTFCTIRRTMGADIAGACGQLAVVVQEIPDIEDAPNERYRHKIGLRETTNIKRRKVDQISLKSTCEGNSKSNADRKSDHDIEKWIRPLTYLTAITTICFALSVGNMLSKRRKS